MPSISSSQGMGQYRYNKNDSYIQNKVTFGPTDSYNIQPIYRTQGESIVFRDVEIPLGDHKISYGTTYYLHLELPQHMQYTTTVKIKICGNNSTLSEESINEASLINFQTIRELIIPPAPPIADEEAIETIILYEDPWLKENQTQEELSPKGTIYQADIVYDWPENEILLKPNNAYEKESKYYKTKINNGSLSSKEIINYSLGKIEKRWLTAGTSASIASFDIVFSPTYNFTDGYSFIFLEIDRSGGYQTQIQYIGQDGESYYGTYMDLANITGELYEVSNLLLGGTNVITAPIKSATGTLNHIAVWSHPELLLAINGEEIKVGQTNFYELDDFTITSLGVVAKDSSDRFTIDYQYQIS